MVGAAAGSGTRFSVISLAAPRLGLILLIALLERAPHCNDGTAGGGLRAILVPCIHQPPALAEQIATLIGLFGRTADQMCQSRLDDFTWEAGAFSGPGAKR